MENTEHYNLNLPDGEDIYNINDFNQNTEKIDDLIYDIEEDIADMKVTFRAGVDACYDACVTKGSTPDSHALSDVVQGILDIETGGGSGDCYSMFPQEISGKGGGGCGDPDPVVRIRNDEKLFIAYVIVSDNPTIKLKFDCTIISEYTGTIYFDLIIDNTTTIQNIGSINVSESETLIPLSIEYTVTTPLSTGNHIFAIKSRTSMYYASAYWAMCNFYGVNFVSSTYYNIYLDKGVFPNFIPNNFVNPSTPVNYQLVTGPDGCCSSNFETVIDAMNNRLYNSFDSGNCFHIYGITGYWDDDGEGGTVYVVPDTDDTFTFTNGKFVYHHLRSRTFNSKTVQESHYFLLPFVSDFYNSFPYISIHGRVTSFTEGLGYFAHIIFGRVSQNEVEMDSEFPENNAYMTFHDGVEGEEFIISNYVTNWQQSGNGGINFIGLAFYWIESDSSEFTVEIDKIWGTNDDLTTNNISR